MALSPLRKGWGAAKPLEIESNGKKAGLHETGD